MPLGLLSPPNEGSCFPWLYVLILLDMGGIQEYVSKSSVGPKEKHYVTVGSWTVGRAPDLHHNAWHRADIPTIMFVG